MARLAPEQALALRLVSEGRNVFLTGDPGTGKSHTLREISAALERKHGAHRVLKVAPTGAAALLIGGQTINSKPGPGIPHANTSCFFRRMSRKDLQHVRAVIIDEISMLDAEFFEYYFAVVRAACAQWVLCGDFHQLAPVGRADHGLDGSASLAMYLLSGLKEPRHFDTEDACVAFAETLDLASPSIWLDPEETTPFGLRECSGKFAFQTIAWRAIAPVPVVLTQPQRTQDPVLLKGLSAIRRGDVNSADVHALLSATRRDLVLEGGITATKVLPLRASVQLANERELLRLDEATAKVFGAVDRAQPSGPHPWMRKRLESDAFFRSECPAPKSIELRVGAQVLMLVNEPKGTEHALVNGSRGVVERFSWDLPACAGDVTDRMIEGALPYGWQRIEDSNGHPSYLHLASGETSQSGPEEPQYPVVRFANGARRLVRPTLFEKKILGTGSCQREQLPLILAWATTVHKSQGSSLDLVEVNLAGSFGEGQAYVAMSRARSLEGLQIRNFSAGAVRTSPVVRDFYQAIQAQRMQAFVETPSLWWGASVLAAGGRWSQLFHRLSLFAEWARESRGEYPRQLEVKRARKRLRE